MVLVIIYCSSINIFVLCISGYVVKIVTLALKAYEINFDTKHKIEGDIKLASATI